MSNDKVQVGVWVEKEKRERWDDYANELGFESRGALIRNAVRYFYFAQTMGDSKKIINRINDVAGHVDEMDKKINDIKVEQFESKETDILVEQIEGRVLVQLMEVFGDVDDLSEIKGVVSSDVK